MTPSQQAAYDLHQAGKGTAEIGRSLGITRQSAHDLLKRAQRNVQAFENVNPGKLPASGAPLSAEPVAPYDGAQPQVAYSQRLAIAMENYSPLTIRGLNDLLDSLKKGGDPYDYFDMCEMLLERDSNVRSLVDIRSAQTSVLPIIPDPTLPLQRHKKRAEQFLEMLEKAGLSDVRKDTSKKFLTGVAVVGATWEGSATAVTITKLTACDLKSFLFDRQNPKKLWVRPGKPGEALREAYAGEYAVAFSGGKPGNPARSGLAIPAAVPHVLRNMSDRAWSFFLDNYGIPVSAVHLPADMPKPDPKEMAAFQKLARDIGPNAKIVVPGGAKAEYLQHSAVSGSADAFERKSRLQDERQAKLFLGGSLTTGTSNTGAGGSMALGQVHNELRYDLQKSDAATEAAWLNELAYWWSFWNFGPDEVPPRFIVQVEEPEDMDALDKATGIARKARIPVSKKKLAARIGLELADENDPDDVIAFDEPAAPAEPPEGGTVSDEEEGKQPGQGAKRKRFSAAKRDPLAELAAEADADWEADLGATLDAALAAVAAESTSFEDLRERLAKFCETGDLEALIVYLTKQRTKTGLAGEAGVSL